MTDDRMDPLRRNFQFQKVITVVGALLMIGKFLAYFLTNSVSILTDALESIVNVAAGAVGLYALFLSMQPPDSSHPYGHGKVELISSSVEGTLICLAGLMIIFETVDKVIRGDLGIRSLDLGLVIVAIAAAVNYAMGATAIRMGKKSRSLALEASGRHLCSDTYSSIGILLGLSIMYVCTSFGYDAYWIDPAMAALFGFIICRTGVKVVYKSFCGIMDTSDRKLVTKVTRCLNQARTDDVLDIHHLRITTYGASFHIDAHMVVRHTMTVGDVENVVSEFRKKVNKMLGDDVDITFMAEPCDRQFCRYCKNGCDHRRFDFVEINIISAEKATRASPTKSKLYKEDS